MTAVVQFRSEPSVFFMADRLYLCMTLKSLDGNVDRFGKRVSNYESARTHYVLPYFESLTLSQKLAIAMFFHWYAEQAIVDPDWNQDMGDCLWVWDSLSGYATRTVQGEVEGPPPPSLKRE